MKPVDVAVPAPIEAITPSMKVDPVAGTTVKKMRGVEAKAVENVTA